MTAGLAENLQYIHDQTGPATATELKSLSNETSDTLYFDFVPPSLGPIRGFQVRFHLYAVVGEVFDHDACQAILKGVDGIVFVADSDPECEDTNLDRPDLSTDPLVHVKREDVFVEDRLGHWQEKRNKNKKARRLDPEQTLVEQAQAAAMAFRWKYVDHPHRWQKQRPPKWVLVGFLLNRKTEQYLLKISHRRIARMKQTTQELIEEAA